MFHQIKNFFEFFAIETQIGKHLNFVVKTVNMIIVW